MTSGKSGNLDRNGEKNTQAKLTMVEVLEIRKRQADFSTDLANEYGISKPHLLKIIAKKAWPLLAPPQPVEQQPSAQ